MSVDNPETQRNKDPEPIGPRLADGSFSKQTIYNPGDEPAEDAPKGKLGDMYVETPHGDAVTNLQTPTSPEGLTPVPGSGRVNYDFTPVAPAGESLVIENKTGWTKARIAVVSAVGAATLLLTGMFAGRAFDSDNETVPSPSPVTNSAPVTPTPIESVSTPPTPEASVEANDTAIIAEYLKPSYKIDRFNKLPIEERMKLVIYVEYLKNAGGLYAQHFDYELRGSKDGEKATELNEIAKPSDADDERQLIVDRQSVAFQTAVAAVQSEETGGVGLDNSTIDLGLKLLSGSNLIVGDKADHTTTGSMYDAQAKAIESYFEDPDRHNTVTRTGLPSLNNLIPISSTEIQEDDEGCSFKDIKLKNTETDKRYVDRYVLQPYDVKFEDPYSPGNMVHLTGAVWIRATHLEVTS